jgi:hypothetical protein
MEHNTSKKDLSIWKQLHVEARYLLKEQVDKKLTDAEYSTYDILRTQVENGPDIFGSTDFEFSRLDQLNPGPAHLGIFMLQLDCTGYNEYVEELFKTEKTFIRASVCIDMNLAKLFLAQLLTVWYTWSGYQELSPRPRPSSTRYPREDQSQ